MTTPKRYPSQNQTRSAVMEKRASRGLCDRCGGKAEDRHIWGKKRRICVNPDAVHGFHEVGKNDGAVFTAGRASATVPAELLKQ